MMPTTPSGCGIRRFLAGKNCSEVATRFGAIHFFRCLGGVLDLAEHHHGLGDRGLDRAAMAEIRRDRLLETGFVVRDRRPQPRQPVQPLGERRRRRRSGSARTGGERRPPGRFAQGFSVTGPWRFLRVPWPEAGLLRSFWQERPARPDLAQQMRGSAVIKSSKDRPRAFPKRVRVGTYRSHPMASARVAFSGSLRTGSIGAPGRWPDSFRHRFLEGAQRFIAGWSSPVARQAHNLKVIGSNPIPATKINPSKP